MADQERKRIAGLIDQYGAENFMQAFLKAHPRQADRIQSVIDERGLPEAARMLFNYQPRVESRRVPGSAAPTLPNPLNTGAGTAVSQTLGVGASPSGPESPRAGGTEQLSRQLRPRPGAATGLRASVGFQDADALPVQGPPLPAQGAPPPPDATHDVYAMFDRVAQMSQASGVPMPLLMGMIKQESQFDPAAVSRAGAKGLIQMMPDTARDRGLHVSAEQDDRLTPLRNLEAGLDHMKWIQDNFQPTDVKSWLAAYNAGHTRLRNDAWKRMKEPTEYANKVTSFAKEYQTDPTLMAKDFLMLFNNIKGVR